MQILAQENRHHARRQSGRPVGALRDPRQCDVRRHHGAQSVTEGPAERHQLPIPQSRQTDVESWQYRMRIPDDPSLSREVLGDGNHPRALLPFDECGAKRRGELGVVAEGTRPDGFVARLSEHVEYRREIHREAEVAQRGADSHSCAPGEVR